RNANAFMAKAVHIVGKRRWNRRGAMVTDRYQHVHHHETAEEFANWAKNEDLPILGIDNIGNSVPIETAKLPEKCVLVFGQEGPGLSKEMISRCEIILEITQYGSTRSINAGVASGIAMYEWLAQNGPQ
ncbi:MAG: TrmH family RNA methyltransferase, partial [Actinomycetota bacterium]|nr:TrmH family RNA methyltransferase [Actinomycetota bacterium]